MMILGLPWFIKYEVWMLVDDMIYGNTTHECWLYMEIDSLWDLTLHEIVMSYELLILTWNMWNVFGFIWVLPLKWWCIWDTLILDMIRYDIGIEYLSIWMMYLSHMAKKEW